MLDGIPDERETTALAILILYAALLPAAAILTIRLRQGSRNARAILDDLHLLTRRLLRDNAINVQRRRERGLEVRPGPLGFSRPLLLDDAALTGAEISDDEERRFADFSAEDHAAQLKRVLDDIPPILDEASREGFVSGLNIGLLIVSALLIVFGLLTGFTGIGLVVAIIGAIVLILDIIGKLVASGLPSPSEERAKALEAELAEKKERFEELRRRQPVE